MLHFPNFRWFAALVMLAALMVSVPVHAGGILKIDQSVINGEIISFDGKDITVQTGVIDSQPVRQTIPLTEAIRVRFAGGSATINTPRMTSGSGMTLPPVIGPLSAPGGVVAPEPRGRGAVVAAPAAVAAPTRRGAAVPPLPPPEAPQPIVLPVAWQLKSSAGDILEGRIRSWTQEGITFEFQQNAPAIEVPTARVAEVWRAAPDLIRKAMDLKAASEAQDVAYVVRDRDIVAVQGVAKGIDGESLTFNYEGQDRKVAVARLLGVVLVPPKAQNQSDGERAAFHQVLTLSNGVLLGHWLGLANDRLVFKTMLGPELSLPVSGVIALENRNGRMVYLSDCAPVKVEQTPYFDRVIPYRNNTALGGGPLRLGNAEHAQGIAVHSRCVLEYELGGQFEQFQTMVGFEQPLGAIGRAVVRVLADGKPVYENTDARGDQPPATIDANIRGVRRLTLEVDFGQDQDVGDRIIWAGARLLRAEVGR